MQRTFPSNKKAFTLGLEIRTTRPRKLRIEAREGVDPKLSAEQRAFVKPKPNTYYYKTIGDVNGFRRYDLVFPQSPEWLDVRIYDAKYPSYAEYLRNTDEIQRNSIGITKTEVSVLETTPTWLSDQDRSFIRFAQQFSDNAGVYSGTNIDKTPSIYRSNDGKFTIDYYDKIIDRETKNFVNSPARIGHQTGVIEVSKNSFKTYTIPMRMIILLHEYSHKWRNPASGLRMENESGADINALEMYLAMGYSPIEAHQAFLYVFKDANNKMNQDRYEIISDFIGRYKKGELRQYYNSNRISKA